MRAQQISEGLRDSDRRAVLAAVGLGAGAALITSYLGFRQGGFFPGSTATVTLGLALVLIARVVLIRRPFAGLAAPIVIVITVMAVFAGLTLVSANWSHAPGRAVVEFNRALFYLVVLIAFASASGDDRRLAALAAGVAAGFVILSTAGFLTRSLPHLFPLSVSVNTGRLGYPLTYRNAVGLTAVQGMLMCLAVSASARLPAIIKALATAGVPVLGATLLLTFSRGAIVAGLGALVLFAVMGRTRSTTAALAASAVAAAPAIVAAYSATTLAQSNPTGLAAVSQGRSLAITVFVCCVLGVPLRLAAARWERRHTRSRLTARQRRRAGVTLLVGLLATLVISMVTTDLPSQISGQYHQFIVGNRLPANVPLRDRLLNVGNNGRLPLWRVAISAFDSEPLRGHGAGTFEEVWDLRRPRSYAIDVLNAHSLYLEVMAELGVLGLFSLLVVLGSICVGLVRRLNGGDRALTTGVLATIACWLVHAGVDWDWQMPANGWWVFAAGGLCLASRTVQTPARPPLGQWRRLAVAVAIGAAAVLPLQVVLSQNHLDDAVVALRAGNCGTAVSSALQATSALPARAEPFEILGYCDARYGFRDASLTMIQSAINRDPSNWQYRYDLALVRALGGLDPRHDAAQAVALNPLSPVATQFAAEVNSPRARVWRVRARAAQLLIP